jgi:hypothetical protein
LVFDIGKFSFREKEFIFMGILSIIIGLIWFVACFIIGRDGKYVTQQTVEFLGYICGSIFLVGGMILLKMDNTNPKTNEPHRSENGNIKIQKGLWEK